MDRLIDYGYINLDDYSGTIDWGDGTTSAASFEVADSGKIAVMGTHTYNYVVDPDTNDVARPLSDYGELSQYPMHIHVVDLDGAAADFTWLASARMHNWINIIDDANKPRFALDGNASIVIDLPLNQDTGGGIFTGPYNNICAVEENKDDAVVDITTQPLVAFAKNVAGPGTLSIQPVARTPSGTDVSDYEKKREWCICNYTGVTINSQFIVTMYDSDSTGAMIAKGVVKITFK